MWQYAIKVVVTAAVVVAITELSKRSTFWGAALASLPLTSLLAFVWLYLDTGDTQRISALSTGVFWLVWPSLLLFLLLPTLLRNGLSFWWSLLLACAATACAYGALAWLLNKLGIEL